MKKFLLLVLMGLMAMGCEEKITVDTSREPSGPQWKITYDFDGSISEDALNSYLDRAVTASEFLVSDEFLVDGAYPEREKDVQLIKDLGVKYVGRAIFRWGGAQHLNNPKLLADAKARIEALHQYDPDIIFQAAVFEAVYKGEVDQVKVPSWIFEQFGLPVEDRCFSFEAMRPENGRDIQKWGNRGTCPDIRRLESQMWFVYLMESYISIGCEAIHLGQVHMIGKYDENWECYSKVISMVRDYAKTHARRHWVILDAHTTKGMQVDGVSLLDFHSFPQRPKEVTGGYPLEAELRLGQGVPYKKTYRFTTPSGWKPKHFPYMVEFDNFGIAKPYQPHQGSFVWGFDEITWFYKLTKEQKTAYLKKSYEWIRKTDPTGHLQMPVARVITPDNGPRGVARAIAPSALCPTGMDIVDAIRDLWENDPYYNDANR